MALKSAPIYLGPLLKKLNVNPASPHAAFHLAYVQLMLQMLGDADVVAGDPTSGLKSPPGTAGGSILGTGVLE